MNRLRLTDEGTYDLASRLACPILLTLWAALPAAAPDHKDSPVPPTIASDFTLADQHGAVHEYRFPRERVAVLIFADRKGVGQVEPWVRPLYDRYAARIDIQGIAHVAGVPDFARGAVKKFLQALSKAPILLDWDGAVTEAYRCEQGKANVVVVAPDGTIGLCIVGPATETSLAAAYRHIDGLLEPKTP